MLKGLLIAATFLAASVQAHAIGSANMEKPTEASVENFLVISGLKTGLDKMPGQLFAQLFANVPASIPESTKHALAESYSTAYPDGSITAAVVKAIQMGTDRAKILHLLEVVSSPLARKMIALESKDPKPEELSAFVLTLTTKPPSKERIGLVKELLNETRTIDNLTKIASVATKSIELAKSSGCADDMKRISIELKRNRPAIDQAIASGTMMSMLFTYRTASDGEIRDYLATYKDPVFKATHLTIGKTVVDEYLKRWKAFDKTLERVGRDLSDESMFAKSCRSKDKDKADISLKPVLTQAWSTWRKEEK